MPDSSADTIVLTFILGVSLGTCLGVVIAGICFASHERQPDCADLQLDS